MFGEDNPLAEMQTYVLGIFVCFLFATVFWHAFLLKWKASQSRTALLVIDYIWLISAVTSAILGAFHVYYSGLLAQSKSDLRHFDTYLSQNIALTQSAELWCKSGVLSRSSNGEAAQSEDERRYRLVIKNFCEQLSQHSSALDMARDDLQELSAKSLESFMRRMDKDPITKLCIAENNPITLPMDTKKLPDEFLEKFMGNLENICNATFIPKMTMAARMWPVFIPLEHAETYISLARQWVYLLVIAAALRITRTSIEIRQAREAETRQTENEKSN